MHRTVHCLVRGLLVTLLLIMVLPFHRADAQEAAFRGLGDLPGGTTSSQALGVSENGQFVTGIGRSENGIEAFRWSASDGMVALGNLANGNQSRGYSVSDAGVVAGYGWNGTSYEGFRADAGGMQGIGLLTPGPGSTPYSQAYRISADGTTLVGGSNGLNGSESFRWTTTEGLVGIGDLRGGLVLSHANAVSADGSVIVGVGSSTAGLQAYRWTAESGMRGLGDLDGGSYDSEALGVSADGSIVVGKGRTEFGYQAFVWTAGDGIRPLGDLPTGVFDSRANAVSGDGRVIVGWGWGGSRAEAVLWKDGITYSIKEMLETAYCLNLTGWSLSEAIGVSRDGTVIVGYGQTTEAWHAVVPPIEVGKQPPECVCQINAYEWLGTEWSQPGNPTSTDLVRFILDTSYWATIESSGSWDALELASNELIFQPGNNTITLNGQAPCQPPLWVHGGDARLALLEGTLRVQGQARIEDTLSIRFDANLYARRLDLDGFLDLEDGALYADTLSIDRDHAFVGADEEFAASTVLLHPQDNEATTPALLEIGVSAGADASLTVRSGERDGATYTASLIDLSLASENRVHVGVEGSALLRVEGGAHVSGALSGANATTVLGLACSGVGTLEVVGKIPDGTRPLSHAYSFYETGTLLVGYRGEGHLIVDNHGVV